MATRNPYYIQQESQMAEPIDWNTVIGDLTTRYRTIKKEREGQREALDALVDTNSKILQATQLGKSPNINEFILRGTEMGRSKLNEWNKLLKSGQLNPSEYKNRINNLMDSWNQLAITTKTYDERMQEIFKNQQPDENGVVKGSALELERANELAQYQDLKNKTLMFDDPTGKIFLAKINNEGILDPTSVTDPRALNNFANIIDNKVQLASLVDAGTEGWKTFKIENGQRTVNDIRQNKDAYAKAKASLINGILSNNSAIASVLTDYTNDEYDYYLNNDDFLSRVQKRIQTENYARELNNKQPMTEDELNKFIESQKSKFILLTHDDQGILQPQPTEAQRKAALDTVDAEIEIRMGKEEIMDEPYRGGTGGSGAGGGSTKSDNFAVSTYIAANKALEQGDFSNLDNDQYNFSQGTDSSGKKFVKVSKRAYDERSKTYYNDPKAKVIRVYSADGLASYIKGMDKQKNLPTSIYNSGKNDFFKLNNYTLPGTYKQGQSSGQSNDPLGLGI
jgi:hypothetical protein